MREIDIMRKIVSQVGWCMTNGSNRWNVMENQQGRGLKKCTGQEIADF